MAMPPLSHHHPSPSTIAASVASSNSEHLHWLNINDQGSAIDRRCPRRLSNATNIDSTIDDRCFKGHSSSSRSSSNQAQPPVARAIASTSAAASTTLPAPCRSCQILTADKMMPSIVQNGCDEMATQLKESKEATGLLTGDVASASSLDQASIRRNRLRAECAHKLPSSSRASAVYQMAASSVNGSRGDFCPDLSHSCRNSQRRPQPPSRAYCFDSLAPSSSSSSSSCSQVDSSGHLVFISAASVPLSPSFASSTLSQLTALLRPEKVIQQQQSRPCRTMHSAATACALRRSSPCSKFTNTTNSSSTNFTRSHHRSLSLLTASLLLFLILLSSSGLEGT